MEHLSNVKGIHNKILAGKFSGELYGIVITSLWYRFFRGKKTPQNSSQVLEILEFFKVTC